MTALEVTYVPGQSVPEVVHGEQPHGHFQVELVVELNALVHAQELVAVRRKRKVVEGDCVPNSTKQTSVTAQGMNLNLAKQTYFWRYSSESHSLRTYWSLVWAVRSSRSKITSIRLFTVLSTG